MKVRMTKGFLAMRSHASKPCVSIRERAGTRCTSMPVMPGGTGRRKRYHTSFRFTYFHGPSAARPLGWPLRMTNGKVSSLCLFFAFGSFMVGQEWFQGFIKAEVLYIVLSSLKKYGDKIEDFHKTTETINKELSEQQIEHSKTQNNIRDVQERIVKQQEKLENIELFKEF
jgi:hypothetical protein